MRVNLSDKNVIRYSTIFLYPFYYAPDKKDIVETLEKTGNWKAERYDINDVKKYAEYVYFHPFIRDILFGQKGEPHESPVTYIRYKSKNLFLGVKYPSKWEDYVPFQEIDYPVDSIQISLFEFGVGILAIQVGEELLSSSKKFKEILYFNELVRRIAPSFDPAKQKHFGLLLEAVFFRGIDNTKETFPDNVYKSVKDNVVYVSRTISELLSPLENLDIFKEENKGKLGFKTALDERMVVYSYICLDKDDGIKEEGIMVADEDFLTFTLVDKEWEGSFANRDLISEYLKVHAYDNWKEYGTRYGFSRYSGTCLVLDSKEEVIEKIKNGKESFSYHTLYTHFETIYYEIALLVYFHRVALLKFSKEAADCSDKFYNSLIKNGKKLKREAHDMVRDLRAKFLLFHNKYWFTEVTNIDQGIDIFNKWEDAIKNRQLFEEVRQELVELNEFVEREHSSNLNLLMGGLTFLASVGGILTVWVGFLGINIPPVVEEKMPYLSIFGKVLFVACFIFTVLIVCMLFSKKIRSKIFEKIADFVRGLK